MVVSTKTASIPNDHHIWPFAVFWSHARSGHTGEGKLKPCVELGESGQEDAGLVNFVFVEALTKPQLTTDTEQRCILDMITGQLVHCTEG